MVRVRTSRREYLDNIVSNSVDIARSWFGERVWEGLDQLHECGTAEGAFVIVVAEDYGVGNFPLYEGRGELEGGLALRY